MSGTSIGIVIIAVTVILEAVIILTVPRFMARRHDRKRAEGEC